MQKIIPHLWFDSQAEEAVKFYTSVFSARSGPASDRKNSKIGQISRYTEATKEVSGKPAGSVMTIAFQLEGQDFLALNGGPEFKFNESISLMVTCETQEEIDYYWDKLKEGGDEKSQICGWLKDKYGLSWQITPTALVKMLTDKDPAKVERVMAAVLEMKKLDIAKLKKAYEGQSQ